MNKIYKIVFEALSAIAITKKQYNILYLTEFFIPGWTVWGALVKIYALNKKVSFRAAQDEWKNVRLTNFYIYYDKVLYLPHKRNCTDNVCWGELSEEEFVRKFITSEVKVSIDPLTNTAGPEMLYEREFIKHNPEGKRNISFCGFIKAPIEDLDSLLRDKKLFIGADKNIGFGKVKIKEISPVDKSESLTEEEKNLYEVIKNSKSKKYLIPVEMEIENTDTIDTIFPLVIRLWSEEKGSGEEIKFIEFVKEPCF